jgi:hypothetical protein
LQPDIFAPTSEPEPFCLVAAFIYWSEDAEDWSMLDCRRTDYALEDEGIIACEEKGGDDCQMRNYDPPRLVSIGVETEG